MSLAHGAGSSADGSDMPFTTIAKVVAVSVAKLVLSGGIAACTYREMSKRGHMPSGAIKAISYVNKEVLLPVFIFVNVATGVSTELVGTLYFLPIFTGAAVGVGYVCGQLAARLTCTPQAQKPVAVTVVTFSNVVGLPLPLLGSIIDQLDQWTDKPGFHSRGTSILFLCNCVQSILMWSMAGPMLAAGRPKETGAMLTSGTTRSDAPAPDEPPRTTPTTAAATAAESGGAVKPASEHTLDLADVREVAVDGSERPQAERPKQTLPRRPLRQRLLSLARTCDAILNRPIKASLLGILVGCTPLRAVLSDRDAPLRWVLDAMALLGNGAVPLVIFTLGATLSNGPAGGSMPLRTLIGALVAKLLAVPLTVLCLLLACVRGGIVPTGDGLLPLTMLIIGSSPTAMNISLIATLQGTGQKEVASVMFYEYLLAIVTISLVTALGLLLFV